MSARPARHRHEFTALPVSLRSELTDADIPEIDQRSAWARRLRELCASITTDPGGKRHVSTGEQALIRRAAS